MHDARIAATICGVSRPERVEETRAWATWPIPEAFWQNLAEIPAATDDPEATRVYRPG
jgi:D-threo-aldose 1-dehydrogenase